MASIPLQMHETPWLLCSLAPAHRLHTFCGRRFSATQKLESGDFMINKHLMKNKQTFQELTSKKCPYSFPSHPSFASLVPSFLYLLLPILIVSLAVIFSLFSKALLTHILSFLLKGLFLVSHVPPTPRRLPLHSAPCLSLFFFLFLNLFTETAANLSQGYWQRAGPGFAP